MAHSIRSSLATTSEAARAASEHLPVGFSDVLPANPRLVKRVADAWGMLLAIRDHVGHDESEDTLARAAVVLIRFPGLVDALLGDPIPPDEAPLHPLPEGAPVPGRDPVSVAWQRYRDIWCRPDVQQVLAGLSARQVARCFGREFPRAPRPPGSDAAPSLRAQPLHFGHARFAQGLLRHDAYLLRQ